MWRLVDHWGHRAGGETGRDVTGRFVDAFDPVVVRHGLDPTVAAHDETSATWCWASDDVRVRGQDPAASVCTDLTVTVDPGTRTISIHLETVDLLRHAVGHGTMFDPPDPMPLADGFDASIEMLATMLDTLLADNLDVGAG